MISLSLSHFFFLFKPLNAIKTQRVSIYTTNEHLLYSNTEYLSLPLGLYHTHSRQTTKSTEFNRFYPSTHPLACYMIVQKNSNTSCHKFCVNVDTDRENFKKKTNDSSRDHFVNIGIQNKI